MAFGDDIKKRIAAKVAESRVGTRLEDIAAERNIAKADEFQQTIASYDAGPVPTAVEAMQGGIGNRLSTLRSGRDASVNARTQPALEQNSRASALKQRGIATEGSLASAERANIATDKSLGDQQIQAEALGQQLSQEGGVQQLETEFTSFFNELASNRFSRELSGLSEEMNEYLSAQGAKIGYDQLEAESRKATTEMYGRFMAAIGQEIDRGGSDDKYDFDLQG